MKPIYVASERAFLRYLEVPGDDPPVLWLHGWQCSSTGELLPVAVQPVLRGRRSLLIDFLGHGYSDKPVDFGYAQEDHARTIVAAIDALDLSECGLVGHSMGGGIAVHVATARPDVVSLLVMAEGSMGGDDEPPMGGQSEADFVEQGYRELLESQEREAHATPAGLRAAHLGMTSLIEPRALFREAAALERRGDPTILSMLTALPMPRWYLQGALSDPQVELERDLTGIGVRWRVVPATGHAMGLTNPAGFADAVAEALLDTWRD